MQQATATPGIAEAAERSALHRLVQNGLISREQYVGAMRRGLPACETELVPTKKKGDLVVQDTTGLWKQHGTTEYDSKSAAEKGASEVHHGGNMGMWAWNQKGCRKHKHCNFHVDCPVQLRAIKIPGGKWVLEVLDVCHAFEHKEYRRANSALTVAQEALAKVCVDHGVKPLKIKRKANAEAWKMGITEKQPDGDMVGEQLM